jgi:uncharacterized protein (TIGR02996 family)
MTPQQAFLEAIIAAPDDDTPRLIFADWLEENGGSAGAARAEFVRVQCKIATLRHELMSDEDCGDVNCPGCQERRTLRQRERELLGSPYGVSGVLIVRQPRPEWVGALKDILPWDRDSWTFRRGFVEEIELWIGEWVSRGHELRQAAPLRVVRLTCGSATFENSVNLSFQRAMQNALIRLAQDDEPGDNPVCGLDTLDLSRIIIDRWELNMALNQAFRPWRGLRHLILPNWANLEDRYRPYEIEQWKKRVPSLETVQFGPTKRGA